MASLFKIFAHKPVHFVAFGVHSKTRLLQLRTNLEFVLPSHPSVQNNMYLAGLAFSSLDESKNLEQAEDLTRLKPVHKHGVFLSVEENESRGLKPIHSQSMAIRTVAPTKQHGWMRFSKIWNRHKISLA